MKADVIIEKMNARFIATTEAKTNGVFRLGHDAYVAIIDPKHRQLYFVMDEDTGFEQAVYLRIPVLYDVRLPADEVTLTAERTV